ncbi:MAG: DNA primase [Gemmatimonadetes bacterium]|nr:DNA primase [Gemmatimonadota bacterium]
MIPDDVIEQVRDAADLVELIGESVQLKRTGADWRGPCPFHGGTHRNFAVVPKKGLYYCYVCHAAGDAFTYLMKRYGMDYPTAVREVARRVGITIPDRAAARESPDPREHLFSAMAVAQEWFATRLREAPDANQARAYLESRELPLPVAAELGLGFAPIDKSFPVAMAALGLEESVLIDVGLLVVREDGTVAPRFRGRLLFPIRDLRGRVVAFGGRSLGRAEPKYLNSPESPIFHKGSTLYNLHQAKNAIRKEGYAVVVEGYFDVLRPVLAGIENVVAPLGTALTPEQAALLKRFGPAVVLLYDSDSAGLKATFRAGDECLRHGLRVKVATLPSGDDPDSLVRSGGADALRRILDDAVDLIERKIQLLDRKGWFQGVERRRDALDRLLPTIRAAADPIAKDLYLSVVAERVGVSKAVLEADLAAPAKTGPSPGAPSPRDPGPAERRPLRGDRRRPGAKTEARLLRLVLHRPEWLSRARQEVSPSLFEVPVYREIYAALAGLPVGAPIGDACAQLQPGSLDAWQRLAAATGGLADLEEDAEYATAVEHLELRQRLRAAPDGADVAARREWLATLSPEAGRRMTWQRQARKPPKGTSE